MWKLSGRGGRLAIGSRLVSRFDAWEAEPGDNGRYTLTADTHQPDPVWFRRHDPAVPLTCEIMLGRSKIKRLAIVVGGRDGGPLVIEIWKPEEESHAAQPHG